MSATEILEKIGESLGSSATVKSVFGDPIHAEGKTVVPIARVAYGFGGGSGTGPERLYGESNGQAQGGGGGGGARAFPAGVLEITANQTRFVRFNNLRWLVAAFVAGSFFGRMIGRRRKA